MTKKKQPLVEVTEDDDGFVITSPVLPELVTCGTTLKESVDNLRDALTAVLELYNGRAFPSLEGKNGTE